MVEHVKGDVHTNGIENFWALLKRTLKGTYVAVEPFHLDAYVTEQVWRFNNSGKKMNDGTRWVTPYLQYQRTRTKMISTGKRQRENGHRLTPQVDVYSRQIK
jgi:hypothetical protein